MINESFARLFFAGRNPLGRRITTVYADQRTTHFVAGVAKNSRTHQLRREVPPRYFVPAAQPLSDMGKAVFAVRLAGGGGAGRAMAAVRQAIRRLDPSLNVSQLATVDEHIGRQMAQERIMATVAAAFGAVALLLAPGYPNDPP